MTKDQEAEIEQIVDSDVRRWYAHAFRTLGPDARTTQLQTINTALTYGISELVYALRVTQK